jgi:hypothetical protein
MPLMGDEVYSVLLCFILTLNRTTFDFHVDE